MSNLKEVRKISGKTQEQLAEVLGSTQARVSYYERTNNHFISTLKEYAKACGAELQLTFVFNDNKKVVILP